MSRILIIGWPKTGKTTLASEMGGGRCTDELIGLGWSESSLAVSHWFDEPGPWIIEGVSVPRALRKWKERNLNQPPPCDKIIQLTTCHCKLEKGAIVMGKGIDKVMAEILGWLRTVQDFEIRR